MNLKSHVNAPASYRGANWQKVTKKSDGQHKECVVLRGFYTKEINLRRMGKNATSLDRD